VLKTLVQEKFQDTSKGLQQNLITIKASDKPLGDEDIGVIPTFPTSKVVLRVEEITPLDVFYSHAHKDVVRR